MYRLAALVLAAAIAGQGIAQELPPGQKVALTAVTQVAPTLPQYTRVDQPLL